jgi:hypothetical protein
LLSAYLLGGRPREGLSAAHAALEAPGTHIWEPETRRVAALFMAELGLPSVQIDDELTKASDCAERFGAIGPLCTIAQTRLDLGFGTLSER